MYLYCGNWAFLIADEKVEKTAEDLREALRRNDSIEIRTEEGRILHLPGSVPVLFMRELDDEAWLIN